MLSCRTQDLSGCARAYRKASLPLRSRWVSAPASVAVVLCLALAEIPRLERLSLLATSRRFAPIASYHCQSMLGVFSSLPRDECRSWSDTTRGQQKVSPCRYYPLPGTPLHLHQKVWQASPSLRPPLTPLFPCAASC